MKLFKKVIKMMTTIIVGFLVLFSIILYFIQDRMIFLPRSYDARFKEELPEQLEILRFNASQGKQTAFFYPKEEFSREQCTNIWVLFYGNASLAIDWIDFIEHYPDEKSAFLLVEYPGYGLNEGSPGATTILESSEAAVKALSIKLETPLDELEPKLALLGHSLGAAAAMSYAVDRPVKKVILLSPFTDMKEMAKRVVGRPFHLLLRHRFDNRDNIEKYLAYDSSNKLTIIHGTKDQVIPVQMGQELSTINSRIKFIPIKNGDHNMLIFRDEKRIHEEMRKILEE